MFCFHSSSTAGQTNHNPPTDKGSPHGASLGNAEILGLAHATAVEAVPKRGNGTFLRELRIGAAADILKALSFGCVSMYLLNLVILALDILSGIVDG